MNAPAKPLRETMPTVAAIIDDLRAAFGAEDIHQSIRNGLAGVPTFYARENGHEVGTPLDLSGMKIVRGEDMQILKPKKEGKS